MGVERRVGDIGDVQQRLFVFDELDGSLFSRGDEAVDLVASAVVVGIDHGADLFGRHGQESGQRVDAFDLGEFQGGEGGPGIVELGPRLLHIQLRNVAGVELYLCHMGDPLLDGDVPFGVGDPLLGGAVGDVVSRHFREKRDRQRVVGGDGGVETRLRRLDTAGVFPPQVQLPPHVEVERVGVDLPILIGRHVSPREGLLLGVEHPRTDPQRRPGLEDAKARTFEIEILFFCLFDEAVEHRIVEKAPPLRHRIVGDVAIGRYLFGQRRRCEPGKVGP